MVETSGQADDILSEISALPLEDRAFEAALVTLRELGDQYLSVYGVQAVVLAFLSEWSLRKRGIPTPAPGTSKDEPRGS